MTSKICKIKECKRIVAAKLMCQKHYDHSRLKFRKLRRYTLKYRFSDSKTRARMRNLCWNLSFESYSSLLKNPCTYCNKNLINLQGVGLDRINNNKGYTTKNVLPACGECNRIRSDKYTVEETRIMVRALMEYRKNS